jgi:hypothetical protein
MTDKQPLALWLADFYGDMPTCEEDIKAAAELRRLYEVNAELVEVFKRIRFERGFACECGIEDVTWKLIDAAIAKATGEQQ